MNRRNFLRLLLAGAGSSALAACQAARQGGPTPPPAPTAYLPPVTPPPAALSATTAPPSAAPTALAAGATTTRAPTAAPAPSATARATAAPATSTTASSAAAPAAPAASSLGLASDGKHRKVWAWLRMMPVNDVPTSEAAYREHLDLFSAVMPLNGGKLNSRGEWVQEDTKLDPAWPQALPKLARQAGHLYMPGMGNDRAETTGLLEHQERHTQAAEELVRLAKEGRFDSPWDGVYLDIEGISQSYRSDMSGFLFRIARAVKDAGLLLGISVQGVSQADAGTRERDDAVDMGVAAEIADFVDLRCYDFPGRPRSIAPYWWIESCLDFAVNKKKVPPEKLTVGLAAYAQHWPAEDQQSEQLTFDQALALIRSGGSSVQWIEQDQNGLSRQSYAPLGQGYIWLADDKTYRYGLELLERYKALGNTIFTPGMGAAAAWPVISNWISTTGRR